VKCTGLWTGNIDNYLFITACGAHNFHTKQQQLNTFHCSLLRLYNTLTLAAIAGDQSACLFLCDVTK